MMHVCPGSKATILTSYLNVSGKFAHPKPISTQKSDRYSLQAIDYTPDSDPAKTFFATVQNKFHYAITGLTAAEMITQRVSSKKPNMGLVHKKGVDITHEEAETAKNYMEELELKRLELLVEQFLSFAELQSLEKRPMGS